MSDYTGLSATNHRRGYWSCAIVFGSSVIRSVVKKRYRSLSSGTSNVFAIRAEIHSSSGSSFWFGDHLTRLPI